MNMKSVHKNKYVLYICLIILVLIYLYIINNNKSYNIESFTPMLRSFYNPYKRMFGKKIEYYTNSYNINTFINKLKKLNLY